MTINDDRKKAAERRVFAAFRANFPDFPTGEVEHEDAPEFRVHREDGTTLGIEVTELDRAPMPDQANLRAQQALRQHIVKLARERHDATGAEPLAATAHFADDSLTKAKIQPLADWLAEFVAKRAPAVGEEYDAWHYTDDLPPEVYHVTVRSFADARQSFFTSPISAWIPPLTPDDLRRAIDPKESKLASYLSRVDEVWLLVAINALSLSTNFRDVADALVEPIKSGFARIFVVEPFGNRVTELSLRRD